MFCHFLSCFMSLSGRSLLSVTDHFTAVSEWLTLLKSKIQLYHNNNNNNCKKELHTNWIYKWEEQNTNRALQCSFKGQFSFVFLFSVTHYTWWDRLSFIVGPDVLWTSCCLQITIIMIKTIQITNNFTSFCTLHCILHLFFDTWMSLNARPGSVACFHISQRHASICSGWSSSDQRLLIHWSPYQWEKSMNLPCLPWVHALPWVPVRKDIVS